MKDQLIDFFNGNPVLSHRIRLKLECGYEEALEAFLETAKFLYLCKDSDFLVPSRQIDDVWHELILCTREYQKFCEEFLGTFIHHSPELPGEEVTTNLYSQGYEKTLLLVAQNGVVNPKYWKTTNAEAKCGGAGCSSDNPQLAEAKCGGAGCSSDNPQRLVA